MRKTITAPKVLCQIRASLAYMMVCTKEFHMTKIHTNSELAAASEPMAIGAPR